MAVEALDELVTKLPEPRWSRETIFMAAYFFPDEGQGTMVAKKGPIRNIYIWGIVLVKACMVSFAPAEDGLHGLFKAVLCCR